VFSSRAVVSGPAPHRRYSTWIVANKWPKCGAPSFTLKVDEREIGFFGARGGLVIITMENCSEFAAMCVFR